MAWLSGFEQVCRADVPLREHTWYRLGGPARWLCTPRDEAELLALLERCRQHRIPWRVLGRGANVIVRDEGFDGAVFKLRGPLFEQLRIDRQTVQAGAGLDFPRLVKTCLQHRLVGLEALAGIPGTVGGLVRMNAGGEHGQIGQLVTAVRLVNRQGRLETWPAEAVGFGYRRTNLAGCVVTAATFTLRAGDPRAARRRYRQLWSARQQRQPPTGQRSAGCIFKNPPGQFAGALLEQAGLKGERRGGAQISTRHANFVVAGAGATARDVLDLITRAQERVRATAGIELELEAEIW